MFPLRYIDNYDRFWITKKGSERERDQQVIVNQITHNTRIRKKKRNTADRRKT